MVVYVPPNVDERFQRIEYDVGAPDHVPFVAVNSSSVCKVPVIAGRTVFTGTVAKRTMTMPDPPAAPGPF